MEDFEEGFEDEFSNDDLYPIYNKGYPLYKLSIRESSPSMNLLKTFNTETPDCMDFQKDVEKNNWSEKCMEAFLLILTDVKVFAEHNNFTCCQTAAVYEIFYSCFKYFLILPALEKNRFLTYFRETLLLYTVQDPPESLRIFNAIEGFAIAKLFHQLVANNFEMMKYILVPLYQIEIDVE